MNGVSVQPRTGVCSEPRKGSGPEPTMFMGPEQRAEMIVGPMMEARLEPRNGDPSASDTIYQDVMVKVNLAGNGWS